MVRALASDFADLDDVRVSLMRDFRLVPIRDHRITQHVVRGVRHEAEVFAKLASQSDWTVVIAPECEGFLVDRICRVKSAGGNLLGPSPAVAELAADKQRTAEHLASVGVPVPEGQTWSPGDRLPVDFFYPAVLKPIDGVGSIGVRLIGSSTDKPCDTGLTDALMRLERYCVGIPVSVSMLCGPAGNIALAPCLQRLDDRRELQYLGGELPLETPVAQRAMSLASLAIRNFPQTVGYIGVDLVLGSSVDGTSDVVIEVNPRLTTSYVGLRAASHINLAQAMIDVAGGKLVKTSYCSELIQFSADGTVRFASDASTV